MPARRRRCRCGSAAWPRQELHLARVRQRIAAGGHAIPVAKIRGRWSSSITHLVALLPCLADARLFGDGAAALPCPALPSEAVPDPLPVAVRPTADGAA